MQALSMPAKFYQFDYAVMEFNKIINLGILGFESEKTVTPDILKEHVKLLFHKPSSDISISNVNRITKQEFVDVKAQEQVIHE
jgi:hypothetical protein